jgi:dolichol-phosphate mannosyltransferase
VIEGALATSASYICVMDADLQHDEKIIPDMLRHLRSGQFDLIVGSRMVDQGSADALSPGRRWISLNASKVAQWIVRSEVKDLMSGFFMLRRKTIEDMAGTLSTIGFKILVDILATSPVRLRTKEIPYTFGQRLAGQSKLDTHVALDFVLLLTDKFIGQFIPARLVLFLAIGALGVIVHLVALNLLYQSIGTSFPYSQFCAAAIAMSFNYTLNNLITYRDMRLSGVRWLLGLLEFSLISSVGIVANVGIASVLFKQDVYWGLAALAGIAIGSIWNFAMTRIYVWRDI